MGIKIIPEIKIGSVCFAKMHFCGLQRVYTAKPYLVLLVKELNTVKSFVFSKGNNIFLSGGCFFILTANAINQYDWNYASDNQLFFQQGVLVHGYEAHLL